MRPRPRKFCSRRFGGICNRPPSSLSGHMREGAEVAGQRKALIFATDQYEHEGLKALRSPAADAAALSRVLRDPRIGGFDVRVIHNQSAHDIEVEIEDLFSEASPDDTLVV